MFDFQIRELNDFRENNKPIPPPLIDTFQYAIMKKLNIELCRILKAYIKHMERKHKQQYKTLMKHIKKKQRKQE